jgi:hypothetical protein
VATLEERMDDLRAVMQRMWRAEIDAAQNGVIVCR